MLNIAFAEAKSLKHPEVADAVYTAAVGASVAFTVAIPIEAIFRARRVQPRLIHN